MTKSENVPNTHLSPDRHLDLYRQMLRIRAFEEKVLESHQQGMVQGAAHTYIGMEAVAVGVCAALEADDYITSTHRGHGHSIARGLDVKKMLAEIFGRATGYCKGKGGSMHIADMDLGMLGSDGIVGGGIPIAVGAALGRRVLGGNQVIACFFGDGAANQGSFHEALNLAAIHDLPVLFVCENNQWALSTSFEGTSAVSNVADRAVAYSIPGHVVDGNDVEAVYERAVNDVQDAREGKGPILLECKTYRWKPHSVYASSDLRSNEEIESWKLKDPIARSRKVLLESNVLSANLDQKIQDEMTALMNEAETFARESPEPDPDDAIQDIYA